MEIIQSNKGGRKLCFEGYMYTQKLNRGTTIRWQCARKAFFNCLGAISTNTQVTEVTCQKNHNHVPEPEEIVKAKIMTEMKNTAAQSSTARPSQIYADAIMGLNEETRANMGSKEHLIRTIRNQRRKNVPVEPTNTEFEIPQAWQIRDGNENIVIYDSGSNPDNRTIVFSSITQLQQMGRSTRWFMDGSFGVCPSIFQQLYIVRVAYLNHYITCAYALMKIRNQGSYEEMFRAIKNKAEEHNIVLAPTTIMLDFEIAPRRALHDVFGVNVEIHGCFFHLTQSTWRKIAELGLTTFYKEREDVKHFVGMLDGTAFLPIDHLTIALEYLETNIPNVPGLENFFIYFDRTYGRGPFRNNNNNNGNVIRLIRVPPIFPPESWNVYTLTLNGMERTNNVCEGWNNSFRNLVGHDNPSLWVLINAIKKDQSMAMTSIDQIDRGIQMNRKKKRQTKYFQERMERLCRDLRNGQRTTLEALRAIGHCIVLNRKNEPIV